MKYSTLLFLLLLVPVHAEADEITDIQVARCKQFMRENPVITATADEMGLVEMWQGIDGLKGCIDLWGTSKAVFSRPGQGELRSWMIYKRLNTHVIYLNFVNDDPLVESLKTLVRLHAGIAERFMNEKVSYAAYAAVASASSGAGRYYAEQIEGKYGKGRRVIKRSKVVPW